MWALGGAPDFAEAVEDAERLGLPVEIARSLQASESEGFGIWPVNMPVVDAWMAICSQWRTTGLADGRVLWHGLDYASVKVGLDQAECALTPSEWSSLRLMERVAASALNGVRG